MEEYIESGIAELSRFSPTEANVCTCEELYMATFWDDCDVDDIMCEYCRNNHQNTGNCNDIYIDSIENHNLKRSIERSRHRIRKKPAEATSRQFSTDIYGLFEDGYHQNSDDELFGTGTKMEYSESYAQTTDSSSCKYDSQCASDLNSFISIIDDGDYGSVDNSDYIIRNMDNETYIISDDEQRENEIDSESESENEIDDDDHSENQIVPNVSDNQDSDTDQSGEESNDEDQDESEEENDDSCDEEYENNDSNNEDESNGPLQYMNEYNTGVQYSSFCKRETNYRHVQRTRNRQAAMFESDSSTANWISCSGKLLVTKKHRFPRLLPTEIEEVVAFWEIDFQVGDYIVPNMATWESKGLIPSQDSDPSDYMKYIAFKSLYAKWIKCNQSIEQWYSKYGYMSLQKILDCQINRLKRKSVSYRPGSASSSTESPKEKRACLKKHRKDS